MGIQINGQTDTITAVDGSFTLGGSVTANVTTTSGTLTVGTGATVHSPASNTLTLGTNNTERVRIDASGRIGINGTPNATLDVQASSAELRLTSTGQYRTSLINGSSGLQISQTGAKNIIFETNANERLRITSSGNIGIGTDNPDNLLHLLGNTPRIEIQDTAGTGNAARPGVFMTDSAGSNLFFIGNGGVGHSDLSLINYQTADIEFRTNNLERLRIDSSGRLLVGTDTASGYSDRLATFASNAGTSVEIRSGTTSYGQLAFSDGTTADGTSYRGFIRYDHDTNAMRIGSDSSERMRITSDGYVSIGGAVTNPSNPLVINRYGDGNFSPSSATELVSKAGLIVNPDSNNSSAILSIAKDSNATFLLQSSNGSGSSTYNIAACPFGGELLVGTTDSSATASPGLKIGQNGGINCVNTSTTNSTTIWTIFSTGASAYRFYVGMGGQIFATSTSISAISDQRLKENIRDLDAGLSEVLALQPRRFDWKTGKGKDIQGDQGFIAQEFEQVFPEMVDEWKDPAPEGEEPYKSVRADLIPVLVKAIQEQQAMIETLEAKVAALENS